MILKILADPSHGAGKRKAAEAWSQTAFDEKEAKRQEEAAAKEAPKESDRQSEEGCLTRDPRRQSEEGCLTKPPGLLIRERVSVETRTVGTSMEEPKSRGRLLVHPCYPSMFVWKWEPLAEEADKTVEPQVELVSSDDDQPCSQSGRKSCVSWGGSFVVGGGGGGRPSEPKPRRKEHTR